MTSRGNRRRYVGVRSFQEDESGLFFGRDREIKDLSNLIFLERGIVLFGRSGVGKSSLLKAGVFPKLKEEKKFIPINVRLQRQKDNEGIWINPSIIFRDHFDDHLKEQGIKDLHEEKLLEFFGEKGKNSLWAVLKTYEYIISKDRAVPVLVIDQFEEFFLHDENVQKKIRNLIASIFLSRIPEKEYGDDGERASFKDFYNRLKTNASRSEDGTFSWLSELRCKMVLVLRSDQLGQLDSMTNLVPNIMKNRYQLNLLSERGAMSAIEDPAGLDDDGFEAPKFDYDEKFLEKLLKSIKGESGTIEPWNVQIICQHIEAKVISSGGKLKKIDSSSIEVDSDVILQQYYIRQIKSFDKSIRSNIRYFIEEELIVDESRVNINEIVVLKKVTSEELSRLVESGLVREVVSNMGKSYELTHDILIDVVQNAFNEEDKKKEKARNRKNMILMGVIILFVAAVLVYKIQSSQRAVESSKREEEKATQKAIANNRRATANSEVALASYLLASEPATAAGLANYLDYKWSDTLSALLKGNLQQVAQRYRDITNCSTCHPFYPLASNQRKGFFVTAEDGMIHTWSKSGEHLKRWPAHSVPIYKIDLVETGGELQIYSYSWDNTLKIWDLNGALLKEEDRVNSWRFEESSNLGKLLLFLKACRALNDSSKAAKVYRRILEVGGNDYSVYTGKEVPDLEFAMVQSGSFTMGCTEGQEEDCEYDENPTHEVYLDTYFISKYETTQAQWEAVMGSNPSRFSSCGGSCPVEKMTWLEIQSFIFKLNILTGENYRLPSEAEWEYAARGGHESQNDFKFAGSDDLSKVGWYGKNSKRTHPVGQKAPNALGLYDMSGNVFEWCTDWYDKNYYRQEDTFINPLGPSYGWSRILRGGTYGEGANRSRVSNRYFNMPDASYQANGFRLATSFEPKYGQEQ